MRELTESAIFTPSKISTRECGASELVRGLGLWSATAVVVGSVIGTAIFLVGSEVALAAGSAVLALAAWSMPSTRKA
jgi:APA family basic amino acid/polyamine antiporter